MNNTVTPNNDATQQFDPQATATQPMAPATAQTQSGAQTQPMAPAAPVPPYAPVPPVDENGNPIDPAGQGEEKKKDGREWNGLSIAGFASSFVFAPVGMALSAMSLVQMHKEEAKGKIMAIFGCVIGGIGSLAMSAALFGGALGGGIHGGHDFERMERGGAGMSQMEDRSFGGFGDDEGFSFSGGEMRGGMGGDFERGDAPQRSEGAPSDGESGKSDSDKSGAEDSDSGKSGSDSSDANNSESRFRGDRGQRGGSQPSEEATEI